MSRPCACGAPSTVNVPVGEGAIRQCWTCAGVEPTPEGERAATFSEVIEAALPYLRRVALRFTRNEADADDVIQDAVMRAFTCWEQFDPERGGDGRNWLHRIVKSSFVDEMRRRKRRPLTNEDHDCGTLLGTDGRGLADCIDMLRALDQLEPNQRAVLELAMEGERYQDIAAKLSIPIGSVMSRLWSARRALKGLSTDHAKRMAD